MKESTEQFSQIEADYERVRAAADNLRREHAKVCSEIETAEAELKHLPLAPVPFEDMKAGILDFIEASGMRYAERELKTAIKSFATGGMAGVEASAPFGKPLRYCDLEGAISGSYGAYGRAQLCHPDKSQLNDQVFYFFFAELVRAGLRRVMESMTPADFGYETIHPDKIGSDRASRRAAMSELEARLADLRERRDVIAAKLARLGSRV